jgi:hypothetical protein
MLTEYQRWQNRHAHVVLTHARLIADMMGRYRFLKVSNERDDMAMAVWSQTHLLRSYLMEMTGASEEALDERTGYAV